MEIEIKGIPTHYIDEGTGAETILLLPGWGATAAAYTLIIKQLSETHRVLALDLPGFGKTPEPMTPWSVDDYADFTAEFVARMGLSSLILMGHSYGGRIIIKLCSRSPGFTVRRVVLIDSAGIRRPLTPKQEKKQKRWKTLKAIFEKSILKKLFPSLVQTLQNRYGSADYAAASPVMKQTLIRSVNDDETDLLSAVTPPTLLIWGDRDTATPPDDGYTMQRLIPNATMVVVQDAGHFPFVDQPFAFKKILRDHFAS